LSEVFVENNFAVKISLKEQQAAFWLYLCKQGTSLEIKPSGNPMAVTPALAVTDCNVTETCALSFWGLLLM